MAKYHIQHIKHGLEKVIFYQGDKKWTTAHEHRKIYNRKSDAEKELYEFGGTVVKDSDYTPDNI